MAAAPPTWEAFIRDPKTRFSELRRALHSMLDPEINKWKDLYGYISRCGNVCILRFKRKYEEYKRRKQVKTVSIQDRLTTHYPELKSMWDRHGSQIYQEIQAERKATEDLQLRIKARQALAIEKKIMEVKGMILGWITHRYPSRALPLEDFPIEHCSHPSASDCTHFHFQKIIPVLIPFKKTGTTGYLYGMIVQIRSAKTKQPVHQLKKYRLADIQLVIHCVTNHSSFETRWLQCVCPGLNTASGHPPISLSTTVPKLMIASWDSSSGQFKGRYPFDLPPTTHPEKSYYKYAQIRILTRLQGDLWIPRNKISYRRFYQLYHSFPKDSGLLFPLWKLILMYEGTGDSQLWVSCLGRADEERLLYYDQIWTRLP
jgi:hypothetical protein